MIFLSFMNLFRNYRRTIAILLTVALGTGVLFSFKGFIQGVLTQYRESTIHSMYGHGQINTKNYRESVYAEPWKHWIQDSKNVEKYLWTIPEVEHVFPRVNFPALLKKGKVTVSGYGQGIEAEAEAEFFYDLDIVEGETLLAQQQGILLGSGLAKALDVKPGDKLVALVNSVDSQISEAELEVIGIFSTGTLEYDNRIFRIQLKQAQMLLNTSAVELISVGLKDYLAWNSFASQVESHFPEMEATSFAVLDKVYYQNSVDWLNAQFKVIQLIILSIVLLGIFNSVAAAILERKQEIGNFRANGESITDVMKLITMEGAFLGFIGSVLGMGLTYVILKVFLENRILLPPAPGSTLPFYISFQFDWAMVYSTLALSTLAAVFASILAGVRVARMPIAEALRSH